MSTSTASTTKIHKLFKSYRQKYRHIWEEYSFVHYYGPHLHTSIKNGELNPLEFSPFLNNPNETITMNAGKSLAVLGQVIRNSISNRVLLDSIGAFEDLVAKIAGVVYRDYPGKLIGSIEGTDSENFKLAQVVISSNDRDEIIERMIEEKIRSIFYGNPVNIFKKDSAKLELGPIFSDTYRVLLTEYAEITARRNIIIHNSGRVDRKYIREVKNCQYKLGNKAPITDAYLRRALALLEGMAAITAETVIANVYSGSVRGKLGESVKSFKLGVGSAV